MNWLSLIIGLTFVTLVVCEKLYTNRYDDINVEEILSNRRLLSPYIKCMLDQGRCTPEGKELKNHVKEAIQTGCSKCTDAQKEMARKVVGHMKEKEQKPWEDLKAKYDPEDKYKDTYEAFLAAD